MLKRNATACGQEEPSTVVIVTMRGTCLGGSNLGHSYMAPRGARFDLVSASKGVQGK